MLRTEVKVAPIGTQSVPKSKPAGDPTKLPAVELATKFYSISQVDETKHTFFADFLVMLDWEATTNHAGFIPHVQIENGIDVMMVGNETDPREKKDCHMTATRRYQATLISRMNMRNFPFDIQYLEVIFKIERSQVTLADGSLLRQKIRLNNPVRWRKQHTIETNADMLAEWELMKIWGGSLDLKADGVHDRYCVQILVHREVTSILWNFAWPIFSIGLLSLTGHGVPVPDLADRMSVNLTMFLTIVAFKWALQDRLPKVPYLTTMELYVLATFSQLLVQGVLWWIFAEASTAYCTATVDNWWTGHVAGGGHVDLRNETDGAMTESRWRDQLLNCESVQYCDKVLLFGSCMWHAAWSIWLFQKKLSSNSDLRRMRGFREMDNTTTSGLKDMISADSEFASHKLKCSYDPKHRRSILSKESWWGGTQ